MRLNTNEYWNSLLTQVRVEDEEVVARDVRDVMQMLLRTVDTEETIRGAGWMGQPTTIMIKDGPRHNII